MGKTPQLKLKGNQEVALLDFDVSCLRGKRILAAELWMHNVADAVEAEKRRLGVDPARPDCLRKIGLSTVGTPWEEGSQAEPYQPDGEGHGASYRQASTGRRDWAYPGSRLWDVIMGSGNSLHCHPERQYQGDGWWRVSVEPRLIAAMVAGLSYGLLVEEESGLFGELGPNNYTHARESGAYAPYLVVSARDGSAPAPAPPAGVRVEPAPEFAMLTAGAARVSLTAPEGAFGYLVKVDGTA